MLNDNEYLSYLRYYKDEDTSGDFSWWYCLTDCKVYETSELYELLGFPSKQDIYESNIFVEFDKVDIIDLKKKYLMQKLGKNEFITFNALSVQSFDIKFNQYIDKNNLIQSWYEFEKETLQTVFIEWASRNGLL